MMSNAARSTSSQLMLLSKVSSPRSMATLRLPCWIEITIIVDCLYVDANIGTFADGARFQRQCYARADIESGTCPYGTDKPPIKATFIATLRCKTVSEQVCHRLADALTLHWPTHKAPALIRKSGHGQQSVVPLVALAPQLPAHRACLSPLAPEGEDNHPGDQVSAPPSVPRIRRHNIIPSELCNSRRHRQCSASREEVSRGQKPAKTAYRASDYTIRIMLRTLRRQGAKVLPSNSRVRRRRTSHSREGGTTPPSTRERRTLREHQRTVSARIQGRKVQPRRTSVLCEGREPAGSRSAMRASPPP